MNLNDTFAAVQAAGRHLALLPDDRINQILNAVAEAALEQTSYILSENRKDLERMSPDNPKYDRLRLTEERLRGIASDIRNVATLPSASSTHLPLPTSDQVAISVVAVSFKKNHIQPGITQSKTTSE